MRTIASHAEHDIAVPFGNASSWIITKITANAESDGVAVIFHAQYLNVGLIIGVILLLISLLALGYRISDMIRRTCIGILPHRRNPLALQCVCPVCMYVVASPESVKGANEKSVRCPECGDIVTVPCGYFDACVRVLGGYRAVRDIVCVLVAATVAIALSLEIISIRALAHDGQLDLFGRSYKIPNSMKRDLYVVSLIDERNGAHTRLSTFVGGAPEVARCTSHGEMACSVIAPDGKVSCFSIRGERMHGHNPPREWVVQQHHIVRAWDFDGSLYVAGIDPVAGMESVVEFVHDEMSGSVRFRVPFEASAFQRYAQEVIPHVQIAHANSGEKIGLIWQPLVARSLGRLTDGFQDASYQVLGLRNGVSKMVTVRDEFDEPLPRCAIVPIESPSQLSGVVLLIAGRYVGVLDIESGRVGRCVNITGPRPQQYHCSDSDVVFGTDMYVNIFSIAHATMNKIRIDGTGSVIWAGSYSNNLVVIKYYNNTGSDGKQAKYTIGSLSLN